MALKLWRGRLGKLVTQLLGWLALNLLSTRKGLRLGSREALTICARCMLVLLEAGRFCSARSMWCGAGRLLWGTVPTAALGRVEGEVRGRLEFA